MTRVCVWLEYVCDVTHACVTWHIVEFYHTCTCTYTYFTSLTLLNMSHDSSMSMNSNVTRLEYVYELMCDVTRLSKASGEAILGTQVTTGVCVCTHVWHDTSMCVMWNVPVCGWCDWCMCDKTRVCVWCDSCICDTNAMITGLPN